MDMATLLRTQLNHTLTNQLNQAVQAGDIQAAHAATKQIAELAVATTAPPKAAEGPKFSTEDIKKTMNAKAPWFGVDPKRSAKAVEFAKNMEPTAFKTVEEFADTLIKAVDEDFAPAKQEEVEETEDEEKKEPVARKKTDAPSGDTGRSAISSRSSGPWAKLSDAPKETADLIRKQADKFVRDEDKKKVYIATALGVAYADHQRKTGAKK